MLENAPIIGAWDKRDWGDLVHYSDFVRADFNLLNQQLHQVAFQANDAASKFWSTAAAEAASTSVAASDAQG